MRATIGFLLLATAAAALPSTARGEGPGQDYVGSAPYDGQPQYLDDRNPQNYPGEAQPEQTYQPPPEGVCYDDNNQAYNCSNDADYNSYNQVDDGYDPTAYADFQQTLSPYGNWVQSPEYGQVWVPSAGVVGADFTPYYSGGHFTLTDYGWTWVSDWDWGWAPFHYGRWSYLGGYGWGWVPGRIWGPSWVHWRHGGGYVGWTALPPRGVRIGPPVGGRVGRWNFVPAGQLGSPRLSRVAPAFVPSIYSRTSTANVLRSVGNTRVNVGPLPSTLSLNVRPAPLHTLTGALPRAQVTVRAGMPLQSRPYVRGGLGVGRPAYQAPQYQHPGYQAPQYQHPGYQAPQYQHPGYQAPQYQHPGYQAPQYQHPGYQAPQYQHPGYQAPQQYQRPTYQAPVYQRPRASYQAPQYHYSAPAYHYSSPGVHYSAPVYHSSPSVHYSAPSYSGGGGHSYGGGGGGHSYGGGGGGHSSGGGGGHHR